MTTVMLLFAFVTPIVQSLSFYTRHQTIECGSQIRAEGSYRIPKHERCRLNVDVPENGAVQITTSGKEFKCRHHLSDLMIVSSETKLTSFPCLDRVGAAVFTGTDKHYAIHARNLPTGTHIGIFYYSTHFECGDSVPFDVVGIPLTTKYSRLEKEDCALVLPGRARAVIDRIEGSDVKNRIFSVIRFNQGLRLGEFTLQSDKICHGPGGGVSTFQYDIFCSIGQMNVESEAEAIIHFRLEAPTPDQLDTYRIESYTCNSRFID
ncbi:hypothetical protein NECAME_00064 [Necator americanus]|uniref:ZP domain-containing protein n=1 Tax=Necator americanus TaxID=51031 RepID=W2TYQ2_NECAM|nr:hypothetical protein NECAME_00064 [Necator americanus]ETN87205.1 hypothetical protein NECAME_00064 [Necator americanus]